MNRDGGLPRSRVVLIDSLLLFLFTSGLVYKLFATEYLQAWNSIECTFIADSRMLAEQLPRSFPAPGWQPLWYGGTRFDYIYPPALRYGPALLSMATGISTARAYHIYTALLYSFGVPAVYWLVLVGARSRPMAWLCALGAALVSPAFFFLTPLRRDSGFWVPQRLHVLVTYGEGPHISAVCLLGAALAASVMAFRTRRLSWVALAGFTCAMVVSNNFYGATSLAIFFPLLVWTEWLATRDHNILFKAAGVVALAWGFCAFWLTPSYVNTTLINLKWVAEPGKLSSQVIALLFLAGVAAITWWFGNRRPERRWPVFVFSTAAILTLYVAGKVYLGFQVTGVPHRLVPELDLALILAMVQAGFWCWERKKLRFVTIVLALLCLYPAAIYLRHFRSPFSVARNVHDQYEYRLSNWAHQNLAGQRVLPAGSARLWYNAWFDNPQIDGGSSQGLENQVLMNANWQILHGPSGEASTLWLQALGTDAVIVGGPRALDQYHDYDKPEKFRALLPQVFDDGHDTRIYRVPRRYPGLARVVNASQQAALVPMQGGEDLPALHAYVNVIENGPDAPATMIWHGFDGYDVNATLAAGQALLVQETYDPAWHARVDGRLLRTRADELGFTVIEVPPGRHEVQMRFETPLENRVGYLAFAMSFGVAVLMIGGDTQRRRAGHAGTSLPWL